MNRFFRTVSLHQLLAGLMLLASVDGVWAALGHAPSLGMASSTSFTGPGPKMLAARPATPGQPYTLHAAQLENGTRVREYATPAGVVFAVAWNGPVLPDLTALLGDYFSSFKAETDHARLAGRRGAPVNMERDGLVLRSNGRMRNFFGHAYAPALIPTGVNIRDVLP